MKKVTKFCILIILLFTLSQLYAQTSTSGSNTSSRGTTSSSSTTFGGERTETESKGVAPDFLTAIIGGMLRHPDPAIRKQAIQSITAGLLDEDSDDGGTNTSTGVGGAIFIPDMLVSLSDPDSEVRDIASVGLDMIYGTDATLLRFMEDSDPLIRKYALQVFARKRLLSKDEDTSDSDDDKLKEGKNLLALRTLLVRLKHEEDPEIKKMIQDSLDWFVKYSEETKDSGKDTEGLQGMFGVSASIMGYLNDPDPEIRKQAIETIGQRDISDNAIEKLLERLRIEEDESVKQSIRTAIDNIRRRQINAKEERR